MSDQVLKNKLSTHFNSSATKSVHVTRACRTRIVHSERLWINQLWSQITKMSSVLIGSRLLRRSFNNNRHTEVCEAGPAMVVDEYVTLNSHVSDCSQDLTQNTHCVEVTMYYTFTMQVSQT